MIVDMNRRQGGKIMTILTKEEVKDIAGRAMLAITDEEATQFAGDLSTFIEYGNMLTELNTDGVEPMTHGLKNMNVMREDVEADVLNREDMLKSVKEHQGGAIKVPTII